jgi:Leucine-rich repeat (LRR) protein
MATGLTGLEVNAFVNLRNLEWMDLTSNNLQSVSESSFNGLSNMLDLYLIQCGLSNLRNAWFRDMRRLQELHIEFNEIRELPNGVFANLDSLIHLYLGYNNLTQVTTAPFGENAFNIIVLSLTQNQVLSIEPILFDRLENINAIEMTGNVCNQQNIVNIQQNREASRVRLRRCFDNFGPRFINCQYAPMGGFYSCVLTVRNAEGEFQVV